MTYKSSYFNPCSEVRVAVKDVPGNPESHKVVQNDEAKMHADDEAQHTAHVNISGTVLQRTNHVTLVSRAPGCEMQVVLTYSEWEHNDKGDFKKRADEFTAKLKTDSLPSPLGQGCESIILKRSRG